MTHIADKEGFILSIRSRLLIGFTSLCLPILILILLLILKINSIMQLSQKLELASLPQNLDSEIYQLQDIIDHWETAGDPKDQEYFMHKWEEINKTQRQWNKIMNSEVLQDELLQKKWEQLRRFYGPLHELQSTLMNAAKNANNTNDVQLIRNKANIMMDQMIDLIDGQYSPESGKRTGGLSNALLSEMSKTTHIIYQTVANLKQSAFWLFIFALALIFIVPYVTQRSILGAVDYVINIAKRIAAGERNVPIKLRSTGRLGKLIVSLKTMQEAIAANDEALRQQEKESRELYEQLLESSKKFREYSSKVAAGDLRERLVLEENELLYHLGQDLNSMADGLSLITRNITSASGDIVSKVKTVITSADEQSESINSQVSAIHVITTSLEEIDKSSKQTMAKAQALREAAKNTYEQGKLGAESIERSIQGIRASEEKMELIAQTILDLNKHTQQIGDITRVVNTLAQQSKMLALNASIEALKAGEAGKGFVAVATEVRNLAEQSEQSTVQVQKILDDIQHATEKAVQVTEEGAKTLDAGTKLIGKSGQVIQTLSKMIHDASIASQHIEIAIRQEAVGIEQIVESMGEINRTTSLFSTGIHEMMTFIHHLDEIAKQLKNDVGVYKV